MFIARRRKSGIFAEELIIRKKMNNRILLNGFFGHSNLGDDLLLKQALEKIPSKYNIYVIWPKGKEEEANEFMKIRKFKIINNWKKVLLKSFSMLIYSGGGLFPSRYFTFKDFIHHRLLGLTSSRIIINGIGIAPKSERKYFDMFIRTVDYCSVRDDVSKEFVSKAYPKVVNCGDLYWGAWHNRLKDNRLMGGGKKLLVCLANPFSDAERENKRINDRHYLLVQQMADLISKIKSMGYEVNHLPFYHGSDEKLIDDVQKKMCSNDKILLRGVDYTLDNIDDVFQQYDMGICMRFHSVLLSVKNQLPCVGICYDYKAEQLLKEAGLSEYGIRYGIRASSCFGEEKDMEYDLLENIAINIMNNSDGFKIKADAFARKKFDSVSKNYKYIFSE